MKKVLLVLMLMLSSIVSATEYYVSINGNDKRNGLTPSTSWRTISYAATKVKAGDVVWIKAGNYGREYVVVRADGTKGNPISFIGYKKKPGDIKKMYFSYSKNKNLSATEMPLLNGGNRAQGTGLKIHGQKYIHVKNLQLTNYRYCIDALSGANNLVFDNIIASNSGGTSNFKPISGGNCIRMDGRDNHHNKILNSIVMNATMVAITFGGDNNLIENCKTYADQDDVNDDGRSMDYHVRILGSNNIIRGHYAEHVGQLKHTGHGLVLKGSGTKTENNLIEDCDVVNISGSIEFRHRDVKYNTARNIRIKRTTSRFTGGFHFRDGADFNIVENSYVKNLIGMNGAISFYDTREDGGTKWSAKNNIIKNTIVENCELGVRLGSSSALKSDIKNNQILNCVFSDIKYLYRVHPNYRINDNSTQNTIFTKVENQYYRDEKTKGWDEKFNNYFDNSFSKTSGTGNIAVDPHFEDPSKSNFRLKSSSKLIDSGKKLNEVKDDSDGNKRPNGKSHDIGAFEYKGKKTSSVNANAGEDKTICLGEKIKLTANGGTKYKWSTGATTKTITVKPSETQTYSVTVSKGKNSDTDEVTVTVNSVTANAGKDQTIKEGQKIKLTAKGGGSYLWSTGETTKSITVDPKETTEYEVLIIKDDCEDKDQVKITVEKSAQSGFIVSAGEDETICLGEKIKLTASGGTKYKWSTGATTKTITIKPSETQTYSVTVSKGKNSDTDEVTVTVNSVTANAGKDQTIKEGQKIKLTARGGGSYLWSTGETTKSITVDPKETTEYEVLIIKGDCEDKDQVKVIVEKPAQAGFIASAGEDKTICLGEKVKLTANGGTRYKWSNGATTKTITVKPSETQTYSVTVSKWKNSDTDEVTVTVNSVTANAGRDQTIEEGQKIKLTAKGGDSYLWSTGETAKSIMVSPTETTEFEVLVTKGVCQDSDQVKVSVKKSAESTVVDANAGKDQIICQGESIKLTAKGGTKYKWSTGAKSPSIIVKPSATKVYSVTVSENGISSTDDVRVTVNSVIADAGKDQTIEVGESVELTANEGDSYLWSTGETTQNITVNPIETTNYKVTLTTGNCQSEDQVKVSVKKSTESAVVVANAGKDQIICQGEDTTLTASGGVSYLWSTGAITQSIEVSPSSSEVYSVTVSENGASSTDDVQVTVNSVTADAGKDQTIEVGESVELMVNEGDSYLWSTGETTQNITVSPTELTNYKVTLTTGNCQSEDQVKVSVKKSTESAEVVANAGKDQIICQGERTTLTASGGSSYLWNTGAITGSIEVSPSSSEVYSVTVSENGVSSTDDVQVTVNSVSADAGKDRTIEAGESVELTANGGDSYLWSTGETTQSITVSPDQTFIYKASVYKNGCEDSDTVQITVDNKSDLNPIPVVADAGESITICQGESVELSGEGGSSYLWNTGDTQKNINVRPDKTTTYSLTVWKNGVSDKDKVTVTVENCDNLKQNNLTSENLVIYPNPSTGIFKVVTKSESRDLKISLISLNGNVLFMDNMNFNYGNVWKQLDLSRLARGVYYVRLFNSDQNIVKKVILI